MSKKLIAMGKILNGELQYFRVAPDKVEAGMVVSFPSDGNARLATVDPRNDDILNLSDPRPLDSYEPGTDNHSQALAHMVTIRQMFDGAGFSLSDPKREKLDKFFTAWVYGGGGLDTPTICWVNNTPVVKMLEVWALPVYGDATTSLNKFFDIVFNDGHPTEAAAALVEYINS